MEDNLRVFILLPVVAIAGLATIGTVSAQPLTPGRVDIAAQSNIVEIDRRCGEHMRYIRPHQDRDGRLVHGHCVRDKHRDIH
jgi:hypothetical protein